MLSLAFAPVARAQPVVLAPKIETVIVTAPKWLGDKPQTVIHNFVHSYAMAATPTVSEVTRWKFGICTRTYGLSKPEYNQFVTQRIEDIAVEAGVKLKPTGCPLNVEIVFTAKPQEFLDQVHREGAQLLGPRPSQADTVGKMRYAVQAWYATGTRDVEGTLQLDDDDNAGFNTLASGVSQPFSSFQTVPFYNVEGNRWRTGLNSELAHIYVIADTSKTEGYELGAVADYVAMLALSQTQSFRLLQAHPQHHQSDLASLQRRSQAQGDHRHRPCLSEGGLQHGSGRELPAAAKLYCRRDRKFAELEVIRRPPVVLRCRN